MVLPRSGVTSASMQASRVAAESPAWIFRTTEIVVNAYLEYKSCAIEKAGSWSRCSSGLKLLLSLHSIRIVPDGESEMGRNHLLNSRRAQWAGFVHRAITKSYWLHLVQREAKDLHGCKEGRASVVYANIWNHSISLRGVLVITRASRNVAIYCHIEIVASFSSIEHSIGKKWNEL